MNERFEGAAEQLWSEVTAAHDADIDADVDNEMMSNRYDVAVALNALERVCSFSISIRKV